MEEEKHGWSRWWATRTTCPRHYIQCCDDKSSENALIDKWSLSHIFWGAVFSIPVFFIDPGSSLLITLGAAVLFEIAENSYIGREIAACICCSDFYEGDNFWNSVVDICFNLVGWLILYTIHLRVMVE